MDERSYRAVCIVQCRDRGIQRGARGTSQCIAWSCIASSCIEYRRICARFTVTVHDSDRLCTTLHDCARLSALNYLNPARASSRNVAMVRVGDMRRRDVLKGIVQSRSKSCTDTFYRAEMPLIVHRNLFSRARTVHISLGIIWHFPVARAACYYPAPPSLTRHLLVARAAHVVRDYRSYLLSPCPPGLTRYHPVARITRAPV